MEVFRTHRPMLVRDVRQIALKQPLASSVHRYLGDAPWDTIYCVPLVYRGLALGTLNLYYPAGEEPTEDETVFLGAVADQTAVAVENARLFGAVQENTALQERQHLARELHDSVSQALYGIALGARTASALLDREDHPQRVAEWLDYVLSLAGAGLAEMRALIFELRPESLEAEGLVAALEKQAAALQARHEIPVQATLGREPDLPLEAKEALYRIVQEALHNTVKHAHASRVNLKRRWRGLRSGCLLSRPPRPGIDARARRAGRRSPSSPERARRGHQHPRAGPIGYVTTEHRGSPRRKPSWAGSVRGLQDLLSTFGWS
jgi:signal transduction histidine kinase